MADQVHPVLRSLFEMANNTGIVSFDKPIYVQLTKFKRTDNGHTLRVSDSQFTLACMIQAELETEFAGAGRIVRLNQYEVGCTDPRVPGDDSTRRVYLMISDWSDAGPESTVLGTPSPMNGTHIQGKGLLFGHRGDGESNGTASESASKPAQATINDRCGISPKTGSTRLISIESLSPFISNWKLLARVTKKSDIREYVSKANNNSGRLFNLILNDETGDISATGFTEAVAKFYDKIVEGQQYYFSNFDVRDVNQRFNQTSHSFELNFKNDSNVEPANDVEKQLPSVFFKFVDSIADLKNHKVNTNVDVVAVASSIGDVQTLTSKSSSIPYTKRDIELIDDSGKTIKLTLWGNDAEKFQHPPGTVVGVKGARLSNFNGLSLSATRSAVIYTDPDEQRAHKLKGWYQATGGTDVKHESVSNDMQDGAGSQGQAAPRITIDQILTDRLGRSEKADFFKVKARISSIGQRTIAYPSCTNNDCKKKVIEESDGQWRCEKCEITIPEPQYRYILNLVLSDPTSEELGIQVTAFDEVGRVLYGNRAKELVELQKGSYGGDYNRDLANELKVIQGKEYLWIIKGTLDHYNGEERVRFTILTANKVDILSEASQLLSEIGF